MKVNFVKMHSDGNDFVIVENHEDKLSFKKDKIKQLANRHKGIGFDQFIMIQESSRADAFMRIFNSDGSEAEMCGNAARCVSALLFSVKNKNSIIIETLGTLLNAELQKNGTISISIKIPDQNIENFYLSRKVDTNNVDLSHIQKDLINGFLVNMGNPHIVFVVPNIDKVDLEKYGKDIEINNLFKNNINVEIVEILNKNEIKIKFWERGAGLTMSCGSGILAAYYACYKKRICNDHVKVLLPGGIVDARIKENMLKVTGKAEACYLGEFENE